MGAQWATSELWGVLLLPSGHSHWRTGPVCEHTKQRKIVGACVTDVLEEEIPAKADCLEFQSNLP